MHSKDGLPSVDHELAQNVQGGSTFACAALLSSHYHSAPVRRRIELSFARGPWQMWILGLIVLYGLYRFTVVWYLGLAAKNRIYQPYYWSRLWYHIAIHVFAVLLLALSTFLFWQSSGWLAPVPLIVILGSIYLQKQKRGNQLRETIRDAVAIEGRLLKDGEARSAINQEIAKRFLGPDARCSALENDDLPTLLKCYILPELGLYQMEYELELMTKPGAVMVGAQVDQLIEFYQDALSVAASLAHRRGADLHR